MTFLLDPSGLSLRICFFRLKSVRRYLLTFQLWERWQKNSVDYGMSFPTKTNNPTSNKPRLQKLSMRWKKLNGKRKRSNYENRKRRRHQAAQSAQGQRTFSFATPREQKFPRNSTRLGKCRRSLVGSGTILITKRKPHTNPWLQKTSFDIRGKWMSNPFPLPQQAPRRRPRRNPKRRKQRQRQPKRKSDPPPPTCCSALRTEARCWTKMATNWVSGRPPKSLRKCGGTATRTRGHSSWKRPMCKRRLCNKC
mmetsp:Transcript_7257/g.17746  ORF Transcript_7257/g.17746 Transcript_7257/m.17746 type:complete len:251 (+) Transcript_7257:742-1494(+)